MVPERNSEAPSFRQSIGLVSLVVRDYDEAIQFYVQKLGFSLVEDKPVPEQKKRWVVVGPPGARQPRLLLARATTAAQERAIGNQTGGRVFLFLYTDDFWRDYKLYQERGVVFVREPKEEAYGTVAVFKDLYGNLWDLLQPKQAVADERLRQSACGSAVTVKGKPSTPPGGSRSGWIGDE